MGQSAEFFYRQFPKERLNWSPSAWDKPVVWWPAVASPVENRPFPSGRDPRKVSARPTGRPGSANVCRRCATREARWSRSRTFHCRRRCWLQHPRLPGASRLTVVGNTEEWTRPIFPGSRIAPFARKIRTNSCTLTPLRRLTTPFAAHSLPNREPSARAEEVTAQGLKGILPEADSRLVLPWRQKLEPDRESRKLQLQFLARLQNEEVTILRAPEP